MLTLIFTHKANIILNSVADQVYLNPMGEVDFKGLSSEIIYMKELQEKIRC